MTANDLPDPTTHHASDGELLDTADKLLLDVDFKWLMAGLGWWIDTTRIHLDMSYAKGCLDAAMQSQSVALRSCAARFRIGNHLET